MDSWIQRYQPKKLTEVVGQEKAVMEIAKRINKGTLRQNILLSGPSGLGKTTLSKIIAKTINCSDSKFEHIGSDSVKVPCEQCPSCKAIEAEESSTDFHYFDGAELGKEDILKMKDLLMYSSIRNAKIIYIEEIQNIASGSAKMALLKLIEKPQEKVFFICSTMDLKKIDKAVIDRFHMHFKLRNPKPGDLINLAGRILTEEGIFNYDLEKTISTATRGVGLFIRETLPFLASATQGSYREFVGNLETCIYRELWTKEEVLSELQLVDQETTLDVIIPLLEKNSDFFSKLRNYESDLMTFFNITYSTLVDLSIYDLTGKSRFTWQKERFTYMKTLDYKSLLKIYNDIFENSSYMKDSYFMGKMIEYFLGKDSYVEVVTEDAGVSNPPPSSGRKKRRKS